MEKAVSKEKEKTVFGFATAALVVLALVFSTQSSATLEPAAVISLAFGTNASNATTPTLSLTAFQSGLAELPNYAESGRRAFEVRVLSAQDGAGSGAAGGAVRTLFSFWLADPRYAYYDVVGANGTLTGGVKFNPDARFFVVAPVLSGAKYAAVFDAKGNKLVAVNLRTGKQVEEKEWTQVALAEAEEKRELGVGETLAIAVAVVLAALILLGLAVFRKAGRERGKGGKG